MKHYSPTGRRNNGRPLKRLLDTWDWNRSTSGLTAWQIYDDDDDDDIDLQFFLYLKCVHTAPGLCRAQISFICTNLHYFAHMPKYQYFKAKIYFITKFLHICISLYTNINTTITPKHKVGGWERARDTEKVVLLCLKRTTSRKYRVIHKSLQYFRPLRYSSRDGHAEGEHVNRGRDTPSFCPASVIPGSRNLLTSEGSWQTFLAHAWQSRPMAPAGLFVLQRTGSHSAGISCTTHELFCP